MFFISFISHLKLFVYKKNACGLYTLGILCTPCFFFLLFFSFLKCVMEKATSVLRKTIAQQKYEISTCFENRGRKIEGLCTIPVIYHSLMLFNQSVGTDV